MKRLIALLMLLVLTMVVGCEKKSRELTRAELLKQGPAKARQIIADELNVSPGSLIAMEPTVVAAPLSGDYYFDEKFLEPKTGKVTSIPLGKALNRYNVRQLLDSERALFRKRYGKLEPALVAAIANLGPDERVRVAIWAASPEGLAPDRGKKLGDRKVEELEASLKRQQAALRRRIQIAQDSIVADLRQRDIKIKYRSAFAPVIFVELTSSQIEKSAQYEDVVQINLGRTYEPEHDSAIPTLRADSVHAIGIDGSNVDIAIVEGSRIARANPNLNVTSTKNTSVTIGSHSTHVAGDAASSHSTLPGVAPGANLYSAGADSWDDDEIIEALDWAINDGVRIINCSFGVNTNKEMDALDRYFDYVVRNYWVTITKSAGNRGEGDGNVTSPGLAWNIITVGGINDAGTDQWSDDVMYSRSSFKDPISTHNDREKPEVTAVGQNVKSTTTSSPWVQSGSGGSGTSYAAPMVAGAAALVVDQNGSLAVWPETIKALMMAGASHNIEGARRLSEKDGAGTIDVSRIYQMVNNGWYRGYTLEKSDFNSSGDFVISIPGVLAGQRIKAAIAWNSMPVKYSFWWFTLYFDALGADFDLRLYAPNGSYVSGSYSWDNSFEVVDVTAAQSGTYSLRIHKYRMDTDWEYLGVAWQR